jgi:hypothetical protein
MGEEDFEEQLQNLSKKVRPRATSPALFPLIVLLHGQSKKKSKLSPKLSRLMGEANMAYALREYSKGIYRNV